MICCKVILWQTEEGAEIPKFSLILRPWKAVYEWTYSRVLPENCAMWEYYHR